MAQDLLNVNFQPGGGSVFKRDGYGSYLSLPIACSTCAVHGGYHFQQVGGNDVQLWGNDVELSGSVNDAAFVKLATGTVGATWQCADSQGYAYCLTSSRDMAVKTDGSLANTTYQNTIPLGTMLTFTPLQLVVAGVSGNESTLYISAQNNFLNFTIGVLPSSPFTEPIASPGSRITHIAYYFGKLFWWKDQSFGYATFTNQNDWQLTIVSNQVGTLDNSDAFWNASGFDSGTKFSGTQQANAEKSPGGIFFRGQDNHIYVYDGYYLTRLSRVITPTITSANRKKEVNWGQTSQADFQSGTILPTGWLSTTISTNNVVLSSFSVTENSSTQWNSGTASNVNIGASSITLNTNNSGNATNPDFESAFAGNWTASGSPTWARSTSFSAICGTINPENGSGMAQINGTNDLGPLFEIIDLNNNVLESHSAGGNQCQWIQWTLTPSFSNIGKRVKFRLHARLSGSNAYLTTSDSYILGGAITYWANSSNQGSNSFYDFIDNIQNGSSTISVGTFTSQAFSTGFSSNTVEIVSVSSTSNSEPITFVVQAATSSNGQWSDATTGTGATGTGYQYLRYIATFTVSNTDALSSLSSVNVVAYSTGSYYSPVHNAANLTSWDTYLSNWSAPGLSSVAWYVRASTGVFTVLSSTPAWHTQTPGAAVNYSTGTYFQTRIDLNLSTDFQIPTLNDFTFNWFEGSSSDKSYMSYFNDAIWFSVSYGSSTSTNNRIFYWDILNGAWSIYDIMSNGFLIENNKLYFGDPTQGLIYKFGDVTTDNGTNINSYWRSKSFLGQDPFVQNEFIQSDFVMGESSTTVTYTYTLDSKTSTAFNMTAYDPSATLIQRNFLLPVGKIGKYYDFKFGDNSNAAKWVLMGHRVHYSSLNWKPVLQ